MPYYTVPTDQHEASSYASFCRAYPQYCGGSNSGGNVHINTLPSGQVQISSGQTTLDKALAAALASLALLKGSPYIPTTQHPQNQSSNQYPPEYYALLAGQRDNTNESGKFGAKLQEFIQGNTGLLLIGGVGVVLFMSGRK